MIRTKMPDRKKLHPAVRDLWPTHAGPNVLAWSYADDSQECRTVYTVYVAHPGGTPRLQFHFAWGEYLSVSIVAPERFGAWDTPKDFKAWARAWKDAGDHDTHPVEEHAA